jgi:5-methylcytosine-specific restriction endonuclease McrA
MNIKNLSDYPQTVFCTKCRKQKPLQEVILKKVSIKKGTGFCKSCKSLSDKIYREKNKRKIQEYFRGKWKDPDRRKQNRLSKEKQRFGFDATEFVKNKTCKYCGITNEDHKKKYGLRLTIHHIDNAGRAALLKGETPNNNPNNLEVICSACHPKIQNPVLQNYKDGRLQKAWKTRRTNA